MKKSAFLFFLFPVLFWQTTIIRAQNGISFHYTVSMPDPASHLFLVKLQCSGLRADSVDFKLPVWSPGYYQKMDFAANLKNFSATDVSGKSISWLPVGDHTWRVYNHHKKDIQLEYKVLATRRFVGNPWLDSTHGYIIPAALFLHMDKHINQPVSLDIEPYPGWDRIATGLDSVPGYPHRYRAGDFDVFYDCPILIGKLEELHAFSIRGIPHRFIGYNLGEFDKVSFMNDLKKVVEAGVAVIGDIPYKQYTFIGIGPGAGGIEHLNSTAVGFNGAGLDKPENRLRVLHFLAHEYFHHYNVKRIRPVELGPFDYDNGSRTRSLWVSEGLSVYYEYLMVHRAGLSTNEQFLNAFRNNMLAYEGKPGRLYQTLAQASYETWSDGPFGRTGDDLNKTISYYDKGPVVGMLFDFTIRHATKNQKSLDDVMRILYREYYQQKKRGFTEDELKKVFDRVAGTSMASLFDYVYTTKELDYPRYLGYAGLTIDTVSREVPGGWLGLQVRKRNDSLMVTAVDWESPAWKAGLRPRIMVWEVDGQPAAAAALQPVLKDKKPGSIIHLKVLQDGSEKILDIPTSVKKQPSFTIGLMENPDPLQDAIRKSWLGE